MSLLIWTGSDPVVSCAIVADMSVITARAGALIEVEALADWRQGTCCARLSELRLLTETSLPTKKAIVWRRVGLGSSVLRGCVKISVCNTTAGVIIIKTELLEFCAATEIVIKCKYRFGIIVNAATRDVLQVLRVFSYNIRLRRAFCEARQQTQAFRHEFGQRKFLRFRASLLRFRCKLAWLH